MFVNLETEKITPIKHSGVKGDNLAWPNETNLYIHPYYNNEGKCLNLDTLETTSLNDKKWEWPGLQVNSHRKAALRMSEFINGGIQETAGGDQRSLILNSTTAPYGRVMVYYLGDIYGPNSSQYGWSPDLRFFFEFKGDEDGSLCTIYRFGIRPKPQFENQFVLKGLESALSDDQRRKVSEAIGKKQVWFTMYHAEKNPLNEKTLGPDRSVALGRGLLTSLGDTAHVTYGVEYLAVSEGDVAADFWIRDGDTLEGVWATIARAEPGEASEWKKKTLAAAIAAYRKTAEQKREKAEAGSVEAQASLAWLLATCSHSEVRDGALAVSFAKKAVAATSRTNAYYAHYLDTLAAAYAEAGLFTNAVSSQREASALLRDQNLKKDFESRLKLYESNTPYREAD